MDWFLNSFATDGINIVRATDLIFQVLFPFPRIPEKRRGDGRGETTCRTLSKGLFFNCGDVLVGTSKEIDCHT